MCDIAKSKSRALYNYGIFKKMVLFLERASVQKKGTWQQKKWLNCSSCLEYLQLTTDLRNKKTVFGGPPPLRFYVIK